MWAHCELTVFTGKHASLAWFDRRIKNHWLRPDLARLSSRGIILYSIRYTMCQIAKFLFWSQICGWQPLIDLAEESKEIQWSSYSRTTWINASLEFRTLCKDIGLPQTVAYGFKLHNSIRYELLHMQFKWNWPILDHTVEWFICDNVTTPVTVQSLIAHSLKLGIHLVSAS